jgi:hypothetical protein
MELIARVIGLSLLTSALTAALALMFLRQTPDVGVIALCFACVGGIIGGVAGAANEIVTALRERPDGR